MIPGCAAGPVSGDVATRERTAYNVAKMDWPINFAWTLSPSFCFFDTLAKSSINPRHPIDSIANSTSRAGTENLVPKAANLYNADASQPRTTERMITTPPIVGVPRLT